jgi:GTPase
MPAPSLRHIEAKLQESVNLAEAIQLEVVYQEVVPVDVPKPGTLFGSGTVDRLKGQIDFQKNQEKMPEVVVIDAIISPIQQRNLEKKWGCKVIDRIALILEIFGERAQTYEGRLQVELAALSYQKSRLVRTWTHLERQRGGFGFVGGPGETQLEMDKRLIDERIIRIKHDLDSVKKTRELHRKARGKVPYPVISLVGYTNAGKSTLFNKLTGAHVLEKDMLFATLDPTMRLIELPSRTKIILSDTVGFISDLPTELIAAFRATLEEVLAAEIIIHVRDVAHPDSEAQKEDVLNVLRSLELEQTSFDNMIEVYNKIDKLEEDQKNDYLAKAQKSNQSVALSAVTGQGLNDLLKKIDEFLHAEDQECRLIMPVTEGALLSWIYDHCQIISREDQDLEINLHLKVPLHFLKNLQEDCNNKKFKLKLQS